VESLSSCPTRSIKEYKTKKLEDLSIRAEKIELGEE